MHRGARKATGISLPGPHPAVIASDRGTRNIPTQGPYACALTL